jgi:16S rRNA (guanine527-N7)-methyltransferase
MDIINKYFNELSDTQKQQFAALGNLYADWNTKINVISRKDIDNIYERHILHSLGIAKLTDFQKGSSILDIGTGGGLPGIPLAILFPDVHFKLIDSIGKKIHVATEIAQSIGLKNITFAHERAEDEKGKFDFVVSRAVMTLDSLIGIIRKNISTKQQNKLCNGLICLKGGDLDEEIKPYRSYTTVLSLSDIFEEDFFETKKVVYVALSSPNK